jgi:hypothetical protein
MMTTTLAGESESARDWAGTAEEIKIDANTIVTRRIAASTPAARFVR